MIEIHTLGRTRVAVNGQPLGGEAAWPRSLALIVYMAREPGPDRRQEILGVLWPDREERRARRALNQLIYTLRKASPELDLESVSDALDFGKEVWLDIEEFDRRVEAGDLRGAVELYEGPFLADLTLDEPEFDHWADRQRAEARRKFRKSALQLATEARGVGDHESAVSYCRRLAQADPLDDEAQHLLIECLYLRGDRAAALRQYEKYRTLLAEELDVEPLEHTVELVARIRGESPATVESAGGPGAEVVAEAKRTGGGEPATEGVREPMDRTDTAAEAATAATGTEASVGSKRLLGSHVMVGVVGMILGAALAIWLWPSFDPEGSSTSGGVELGTGSIAIAPFQIHGEADDIDGVGVAQLLNLELSEAAGLPTVPHRSLMRRLGPLSSEPGVSAEPDRLMEVASSLGADRLALGDLHAAGGDLRLVVDLIVTRTGERVGGADVRGPRDDLFGLIERAARALNRSPAAEGG